MKKEMTKTNFVKYLREFVGRTKYAKGGHCERLTISTLNTLAKRYPEWYYNRKCKVKGFEDLSNYEYLARFVDKGWFIADCCGLIKGVRAGYRADGTVGKMTSEIDQTIKQMADSLEDKRKDYTEAEQGEMVYFSDYSHVMTVSERDKLDIESSPSLDGAKETSLFYQPKSRVGGAGKLPWVDYDEIPKLTEDGLWGKKTTSRAQEYFGTTIDGEVWRQLRKYREKNRGLCSGWKWTGKASDNGSELIRAMQKWLGRSQTGHLDDDFVKALQLKLGVSPDGVLDSPSVTIRKFQKFLNESERVMAK